MRTCTVEVVTGGTRWVCIARISANCWLTVEPSSKTQSTARTRRSPRYQS